MALESISRKDLTLDYIIARLSHEVTKRKQKKSIEDELILFKRPSKVSASYQCNLPKTCYICEKPSHFAKNCFKTNREKRINVNNAFNNYRRKDFTFMVKTKILC